MYHFTHQSIICFIPLLLLCTCHLVTTTFGCHRVTTLHRSPGDCSPSDVYLTQVSPSETTSLRCRLVMLPHQVSPGNLTHSSPIHISICTQFAFGLRRPYIPFFNYNSVYCLPLILWFEYSIWAKYHLTSNFKLLFFKNFILIYKSASGSYFYHTNNGTI